MTHQFSNRSGLFINTKRVSFQTKSLKVGAQKVNLSIWDTAGQEKYRSLAPLYYSKYFIL